MSDSLCCAGDLDSEEEEGTENADGGGTSKTAEDSGDGPDYNYILGMPLLSLTKEKKDELIKQKEDKLAELNKLLKTTIKQLWLKDLDDVLKEVQNQERLEHEESIAGIALSNKAAMKVVCCLLSSKYMFQPMHLY